ncbi:phosphatidylinositol-specific phospholipase C/glycerophosphodiester phosphodiesterase family protein [Paenibacillus sp. CN-4]|uniref:phosphatidylinositol-specific phospholipase C/glycerophosphodiester phosphodiesterase family protein n=1 Tax=Paenibacillus nanchangensis TaxID=3348343 RepID=UPI0039791220
MKKLTVSLAVLFALSLLVVLSLSFYGGKEKPAVKEGPAAYRIVAHAMGGIEHQPYTNAYEAFVANYEKGTRIFEVDFMLSTDGYPLARHEWSANMSKLLGQTRTLPAEKQDQPLSRKEFMGTPIFEFYTPLDGERILDLMEHYPDAYIVTDTKEDDAGYLRLLRKLAEEAKTRNPALLDRVVPQIYSREMLAQVKDIYPFPQVIYTLYASEDSDEAVVEFAKKTGVWVTMADSRATEKFVGDLIQTGTQVYVHTVNDEERIRELSKMGVSGFYTDYFSEEDFSRMQGLSSLSR